MDLQSALHAVSDTVRRVRGSLSPSATRADRGAEGGAQAVAGAVDAAHNGAGRDAQALGDLGVAERPSSAKSTKGVLVGAPEGA